MARESVQYARLAQDFNGRLVLPADRDYDAERVVWNAMFDRRPCVLAQCTGSADVISAVRFAREHDLPFTVRGGGHSVDGKALADGALAIDLAPMSGVLVDPRARRAVVQAGCLWRTVDRETQLHGLAVTGGTVSDTGVAGLTLGGGIGWTMRKFGVTVDSLVAINAVSVDGEVVHASAEENPDLFWGMRGAGANFAIATSFEFELHPLGPTVLAGVVLHDGERAAEAVRFWRDTVHDSPDEVGSMALLTRAPAIPMFPAELHGEPVVMLLMVYAGDVGDGEVALAPLREWGSPLADMVAPMPYTAAQQMLENATPTEMRSYEKGGYVPVLSDGFIDAVVAGIERSPVPSAGRPDMPIIALSRMGGAIERVPEAAMAFSRKGAAYFWDVITVWKDAQEDETWIGWPRAVAATLGKDSATTSYINLSSDDDTRFLRAAYGPDKYARLVELKNRWDPDNLLRFNKNIPPSG
jgi:FAD/FMN-containing dehydrogenase